MNTTKPKSEDQIKSENELIQIRIRNFTKNTEDGDQ
jgi:hypothetical protein